MKNILLTTNHPAPYIDKWIEAIEKKYKLTIIYNRRRDDKKKWKKYIPRKGLYFKDLGVYELYKILKLNDLIIVGGWANKYCLETIFIGKILRKKVVIFTDYPFHQNKVAVIVKKYFLYRIVDFLFCATQSTCDFISMKYHIASDKVKIFPYAVNFPDIYPNSIVGNKIKILIANNFILRKGYSILFDALHIVDKKADKVLKEKLEFHIAGHGELEEKLKSDAKKINLNIKFYGWCEPEKYNELQDITQFYIHASLEEPFGIPPLDAMARKKVVIVSDAVKSTDKLILQGINGFIYPAKNACALADIIMKLDTVNVVDIGERAAKDVMKIYSIEKNMDTLEECI